MKYVSQHQKHISQLNRVIWYVLLYKSYYSEENHERFKRRICVDRNRRQKGQIVISKQARDVFAIRPGDTLLLLGDEKRGITIVPKEAFSELFQTAFAEKGERDQ